LSYVRFELSYDKFNKNADHIYRLGANVETPGATSYETTSAPMAASLQSAFPEIKSTARVFLDYYIVQRDDENFGEETLAYADPSVFDVFSFPLLRGNPSAVFDSPFDMVLSASAAKKYFGTTDCLNKTLLLDGKISARVTGVMKDIPVNSHFRTDILLSMSSLFSFDSSWVTNWSRTGFSTYLLLNKNVNTSQLKNKLTAFVQDHPFKDNVHYSLELEPLTDVYLHGKARGNKAGVTAMGNYKNIYIFSIVAAFVLFIACFNFVNLTTAFSLKRAKEIGVRKVMGASKKQLIFQFLVDSLLVSAIAFVLSVVLCVLLLPWFNEITGKTISTGILDNKAYLGFFLLLSILTGLLSGIYPAFFLSNTAPVSSLQGKFVASQKGLLLRHALVVIQFTFSIALIVATIVVYRQLNFIQNEQLGFKKQHNLVIDFHYDDRIREHGEAVESELTGIPGVLSASMSAYIPGRPNKKFPTTIEGENNQKIELQSDTYFVDFNFLKQYGIEIIGGRGFSKDFPSDVYGSMIINETMAKRLGFADVRQALGKQFSQRGRTGKIIGVAKDFHFQSLHETVAPLAILVSPGFFTFMTLGISSDNLQGTIKEIQTKWHSMAPGLPLIYHFSDEVFNEQYLAERRFGKLFVCLTALAILISCLGLLGLTSFNTFQRRKEIGIRKVLGASAAGIVVLLTKDFLKLVLIALLIAFPLSWWGMSNWLDDFAYRITIGWWIFLAAGLIAFLTAIGTIGFLAAKAAAANPIKNLRVE
jgi:putative ABC transport system permease protein